MNIKLQRTAKGEGEIKQKSHALTQSQRLILATVDGVSQVDELQRRLGGMPKRRFTLAIADLTAKGLVEEALNPLAAPTKLGHDTIERFVRQDPLDPVTVTALQLLPQARAANAKRAKVPAANAPSSKPVQIPDVDFYIPLEPRNKPAEQAVWQPPGDANLITTNGEEEKISSSRRRERRARRSKQIQMGYWLIFAGLVCGIVFLISMRYR